MMGARFNPPPGWEVPPGFTPGPGWVPDPAWPPAPADWVWWVDPDPTGDTSGDPAPDATESTEAPAAAPWSAAPDSDVSRVVSHRARAPWGLALASVVVVLTIAAGGWAAARHGTATHSITGTLVVAGMGDASDGCMAGDASWRLDRMNAMLGGSTYDCPDGLGGGFSDLADGTNVTVKDEDGKLLAVGKLTDGTLSLEGARFTFTAPDVPEANFYQIEVSHRGALTFTKAELDAVHWAVAATIG